MRHRLALLIGALATTTGAEAQRTVGAPGGVLTGIVQDSVTGQPVGWALVTLVEKDERSFATEAGKFSFSGLGAGRFTLRITQIGYRSRSVPLVVEAGPDTSGALVVLLVQQPVQLPEVVTRSDECPVSAEPEGSGESGTILDEAFRNAERMLAVQRPYPYRSRFHHVTAVLDEKRVIQRRTVDTIESKSREITGYQRGRVLVKRRSVDFGRAGLREHANYFQASDLARPEFRQNHCFWFVGPDSVREFPAYRIEFRPIRDVQTTDWAGILQIDSASMHLLRSEAWLVNLPKTGSVFEAARCSALYTQLVPTLVLEFQVHCVAAHNVRPRAFTDDRWTLIERAFVGKKP